MEEGLRLEAMVSSGCGVRPPRPYQRVGGGAPPPALSAPLALALHDAQRKVEDPALPARGEVLGAGRDLDELRLPQPGALGGQVAQQLGDALLRLGHPGDRDAAALLLDRAQVHPVGQAAAPAR